MTGELSSAQPNHQDARLAGAVPDRSIRAGGQQRVAVQAAQPDQPWPLLLSPDSYTAPSVGQVAGGPLVVSQASPGGGRHGGGHALAVSHELGRGEAVLAGPLILVAEPQGLSQ
jgi:hypothetical protein